MSGVVVWTSRQRGWLELYSRRLKTVDSFVGLADSVNWVLYHTHTRIVFFSIAGCGKGIASLQRLSKPCIRSLATTRYTNRHLTLFCSVLFFSRPRSEGWTHHLSLSSVILADYPTGSPGHVLMLLIQAVRGLPRLRAPGIVSCIISFSRQLLCFLMV